MRKKHIEMIPDGIMRKHNREEIKRWADVNGTKYIYFYDKTKHKWIRLSAPTMPFDSGFYVLDDSHCDFHKRWLEDGVPDLEQFDTADKPVWHRAPENSLERFIPSWDGYMRYRYKNNTSVAEEL